MSFVPVIPFGGYGGWAFLKRTMATQRQAFDASPSMKRDADYFKQKIGEVRTAEAMVSDRRLLGIALGAYGLDDDIGNTYFIRKVLDDGTLDASALSNRLANKQYRALSAGFGFGDYATPRTQLSDFADNTLADYRARQFEAAVGKQNDDLRLALNAERELSRLANRNVSEDTKWFTIMGNAPVRQVFEKALGLPSSFASLDLDTQLSTLREKSSKAFGSGDVAQFSSPEKIDDLIKRFLVRSAALNSFSLNSPGAIALTLLRSS